MFTQNILMCRPDHYTVSYSINPWMDPTNKPNHQTSLDQWTKLHHTIIRLGGFVHYINQIPDAPDMVFTANGGLVYGNKVVLSKFKHPQRKSEEPLFRDFFKSKNYEILEFDREDDYFEGNGDCFIFNETLFLGTGFRSSNKVAGKIMEFLGLKKLIICELVNEELYHLDTCFCPLNGNDLLYIPSAFSESTINAFKTERLNLIDLSEPKAAQEGTKQFSCNCVVINNDVIMPSNNPWTLDRLTKRGYKVHHVEMSMFIKSGGAAKCLTLKI